MESREEAGDRLQGKRVGELESRSVGELCGRFRLG